MWLRLLLLLLLLLLVWVSLGDNDSVVEDKFEGFQIILEVVFPEK